MPSVFKVLLYRVSLVCNSPHTPSLLPHSDGRNGGAVKQIVRLLPRHAPPIVRLPSARLERVRLRLSHRHPSSDMWLWDTAKRDPSCLCEEGRCHRQWVEGVHMNTRGEARHFKI